MAKAKSKVTSDIILEMLAVRHSEDVFVPECKTGPTHYADRCPRIDAWAMRRSWANPVTFGYEIKTSRNDFVRDEKWRDYLAYCTQFFFVAPPGIIRIDELPAEVGLIETSTNAKTL